VTVSPSEAVVAPPQKAESRGLATVLTASGIRAVPVAIA
jgi:hypothetical protein